MLDLNNKKVTILGFKRSGLAVAELVLQRGGIVRISEHATFESLDKDLKAEIKDHHIAFEGGGHTQNFIEDSDYLVLSPGVSIHHPAVSWAKIKNIPVLGEIEFAFQFCDKPVIAITGSNGKTTVSTLIAEVLREAGHKPRLCGNVGFPLAGYVLDLADNDYVVLEVSSFQMESLIEPNNRWGLKYFRPFISVFLNFSENHLDRHKDLEEYFDAKARIFQNQTPNDYAVINLQDKYLAKIRGELKAKIFGFEPVERSNPNHLAVQKVAEILHIQPSVTEKVFSHFSGVEHRMEKVRAINGVDFINDSKATTAQATRWALSQIQRPIIMICGGRDKNIDFSPLKSLVQKKVKTMIVIGEARGKIKNTFSDVVALQECDTLQSAVEEARRLATSGDCVILTPMCASFDMFKDFEERGRIYKDIVNQLT